MKSLYTLVLFFVLFLSNTLHAAIVGTTKGEFSVNQGTANYNLKIDVPPGVAGMEPKLSLNYSSGGGNGYMGVSWSMGGVSAITRCPQTKAVDGAKHKFGIKYDENDRYCLDGQRLINVSGAYGADGTEYKTEIDTYSKITQEGIYGGSKNKGPLHFVVKTKSGLTYRYGRYSAGETGGGSGSAYLVINGRKAFWKVNDITDTFGNKITFEYKNNYSTGENYLDKVTYADNVVDYVYEGRADKTLGYTSGHQMNMSVRLKEVVVKTGSTEVRRYKVAYTNEPDGAKRSQVASITEHVAEGDLRKLNLTYQNTTGKLEISSKTPATQTKDAIYVDLNGDGCVDVYSNNDWAEGDCKGNWKNWKSTGTNVKNKEIKFADFDGDGDIDFITYTSLVNTKVEYVEGKTLDGKGRIITLYLNNGLEKFTKTDSFDSSILMYGNDIKVGIPKIADFNADGKLDILITHSSNFFGKKSSEMKIYLNKNNKFKRDKDINVTTDNDNEIIPLDIDGDGLTDIYEVEKDNDIVYFNNGNMTFTKREHIPIKAKWYDLKFRDLNGDGALDIYQIASGKDKIWINDGKGNFAHKYSPNVDASANDIRLVDVNGDGYPDLYDIDSGKDNIWLNDGKGNFPKRSYELDVACTPENLHFADINGDGITDMIEADSTNKIWFNQAKKPLLTRITNGTDQDIKIAYKPMTDPTVYYSYNAHNKRNKYAFNNIVNDNIEVTTSQPLVYSVNSANGTNLKAGDSPSNGYNQVYYKYYGYIINKIRGSQGFHAIATYDDTARMYSTEYYKQIEKPNAEGFQYTGMPYASYAGREYGVNTPISKTSIIYKDASKRSKIYEPYTYSNIQTVYDPDSKAAIKSIYHYNYLSTDSLGNIVKTVDRTYDHVNKKSFYKTTINEYKAENKEKWYIGRLTKATVTHTQTDGGTVARSSTFKYNGNGVLSEEVANVGTPVALKKSYAYDSHGNKVKETIAGAGVVTASTTFGYDSKGKFQTKVTNAAGLSEYRTYDARFGAVKTLKGPNGLMTTWSHDGMGRKTYEKRADGTWTKWQHKWYGKGAINSRYVYYVYQTASGKISSMATYYDSLGRETSKHHSTIGKKRVLRYKYYNAKGELYKESLPYIYNQESAKYILTTYDKYGRAVKVTKPGPNNSTQTYRTTVKNFTQTMTDPLGHKKQTVKNAIDQMLKVTDAYGTSVASSISYKYDAAGNLKETTDAKGNKILMTYDAAGNKTYMKDPDLGVWYYGYNAAGKLKDQWSQTAKWADSHHHTRIGYDVLGRVKAKSITDRKAYYASSKKAYSYSWNSFKYGNASASVGSRGKLIEAYSSSKIDGKDWHAETKTMKYDTKGRPVSTNTYIHGRGNYLTSTTYDAYSRPSIVTYPNGYKVTNHYQDGILDFVKGSDGKVHYQIDALTAFGEVAQAHFANGVKTKIGHDSAGFTGTIVSYTNSPVVGNVQRLDYTYDGLGNVLSRNDTSIQGHYLNEKFTYDAMNRLTSYKVSTDITKEAFANARTYKYDTIGNMTYKSGYGNYTYSTNKPHAVKQVGSRHYTYDAVGNMTHRNGDTIVYNPLNKPTIMKNKNGKEVRFYYGVGGSRFMKSTAEADTYYIGKAYEEKVKGSEETQTCYISVGGKSIGTHTQVINTDYVPSNKNYKETPFNRYFHTDALGSITAITDDKGKVVERRSYEPFGKIRAMDYGLKNGAIIPANTVAESTRAFTGHEQIAELSGLIHMNARVYDSDIGRFLSADTVIQDPHDSQAYNRYSYVRNNPLVYTDPSGHSWWSKLWKKIKKHLRTIISIVIAVVIAIYMPQLLLGPNMFSTMVAGGELALNGIGLAVVGATAGFASTLVATGSFTAALKGAMWGAISAGVAYGIGHGGGMLAKMRGSFSGAKAIMHGLSRAAIAKLQTGSGKGGFLSGFASSVLGGFVSENFSNSHTVVKVTMAAIAGGTASVLGGGKFANGAMAGAFIMMFNDLVLENTSAARGMHRRISVYSKDGKRIYGISFGQNRGSDELFGFDNFEPKFGQNGGGIVYEDIRGGGTKIVEILRTSPIQDKKIIQYMQSQLGKTASYNLAINSCRNYSASQFDYIGKLIGE